MGGQPPCQELTMETIDVNNVRGNATQFVANADISAIPACDFPSKKNPVTGMNCREGMVNKTTTQLKYGDYDYSKIPDDNLVKLFYATLGMFGVYLLIEFMRRANGKK